MAVGESVTANGFAMCWIIMNYPHDSLSASGLQIRYGYAMCGAI